MKVLLYAKALNESIEEHGLEVKSNGSYIVSKMRNSTIKGMNEILFLKYVYTGIGFNFCMNYISLFSGVTGTVYINDNGDRIADYALLDMDPEDGKFKVQ